MRAQRYPRVFRLWHETSRRRRPVADVPTRHISQSPASVHPLALRWSKRCRGNTVLTEEDWTTIDKYLACLLAEMTRHCLGDGRSPTRVLDRCFPRTVPRQLNHSASIRLRSYRKPGHAFFNKFVLCLEFQLLPPVFLSPSILDSNPINACPEQRPQPPDPSPVLQPCSSLGGPTLISSATRLSI